MIRRFNNTPAFITGAGVLLFCLLAIFSRVSHNIVFAGIFPSFQAVVTAPSQWTGYAFPAASFDATISATESFSPIYSFNFQANTDTAPFDEARIYQQHPATPGNYYSMSAYWKWDTNTSGWYLHERMTFRDAGLGSVGNFGRWISLDSDGSFWQQISFEGQLAPTGTVWVEYSFDVICLSDTGICDDTLNVYLDNTVGAPGFSARTNTQILNPNFDLTNPTPTPTFTPTATATPTATPTVEPPFDTLVRGMKTQGWNNPFQSVLLFIGLVLGISLILASVSKLLSLWLVFFVYLIVGLLLTVLGFFTVPIVAIWILGALCLGYFASTNS